MKKAAPQYQQDSPSHGKNSTAPTLLASVLEHLIFTCSLNKYEAAHQLGDWSLHSTIYTLANTYGVTFKRTPEKVSNARMPVTRYSIPDSARSHARDVLVKMERKGRVPL